MGIEYKIVCGEQAVSSFDGFVRKQPYFKSYDTGHRNYTLSVPGVEDGDNWPVGQASLEPDGIYFCDNLVSPEWSARILRSLIDHALMHSERIVLHEP